MKRTADVGGGMGAASHGEQSPEQAPQAFGSSAPATDVNRPKPEIGQTWRNPRTRETFKLIRRKTQTIVLFECGESSWGAHPKRTYWFGEGSDPQRYELVEPTPASEE